MNRGVLGLQKSWIWFSKQKTKATWQGIDVESSCLQKLNWPHISLEHSLELKIITNIFSQAILEVSKVKHYKLRTLLLCIKYVAEFLLESLPCEEATRINELQPALTGCTNSKPEVKDKEILSSVQSLSRVRLFATPWTAARQAALSIINSQS